MANIYSYNHEPKMKNGVFVGKKSLVGKIQELQVLVYIMYTRDAHQLIYDYLLTVFYHTICDGEF